MNDKLFSEPLTRANYKDTILKTRNKLIGVSRSYGKEFIGFFFPHFDEARQQQVYQDFNNFMKGHSFISAYTPPYSFAEKLEMFYAMKKAERHRSQSKVIL